MQQITEEYEAAQRGLFSPAITGPYDFVTARLENMGKLQEELQQVVGDKTRWLLWCCRASRVMKTPLVHLVTRHQNILGEAFHVARVHLLSVEVVFAGVAVEQEVFDRVLVALNQLAGTRYTHDDFSDVHILDDIKLMDNSRSNVPRQ